MNEWMDGQGMDIFLSFLSLCHARNLVHIYMYACHTHPSIHSSVHPFIHPSIPATHTPPFIPHPLLFHGVLWASSPLLLFCRCFRPPSPNPPFACCCCFCCILRISPLLLLLLHFSFHVVGLFAAVKSLPTFSRFLQSIKF